MKSFSFVIILLCLGTIDCSKSLQFVGNQENADRSLFAVSIQWRRQHICSGSIVAVYWVLTSFFCTGTAVHDFKIRYGVLDCNRRNLLHDTLRDVVDQETSNHEALSLLMVDREFETRYCVFAILPGSGHNITLGDSGFVYGWDVATAGTKNVLQRATFYVVPGQESIHNHSVTNYEFKAEGNGTGISRGNVGSPFASGNMIIGVASAISSFTGDGPDIFYRVSQFLDWINSTTGVFV